MLVSYSACVTDQQFVIVQPESCLCERFAVRLPFTAHHLFALCGHDTRLPTKTSAAPRATSACHGKLCAWHMHRLLFSLNGRLVQPSERRLAHRLCHQSRWADHSEYIESLNSVKSSLDSTLLQKNTPQLSGVNVGVKYLDLECLLD